MKNFYIDLKFCQDSSVRLLIGLDKMIIHANSDLDIGDQTSIVKHLSKTIHTYCFKNEIKEFSVMVKFDWFTMSANPIVVEEQNKKERREYEATIMSRIDNVFNDASKKEWVKILKQQSKTELDMELISWALEIAQAKISDRMRDRITFINDRDELEALICRIGTQRELVSKIL